MKKRTILLALTVATTLHSTRASAVDGVIELNQASAASSGALFSIREPGSYRLTSDLVVTDPNRTAISLAINGGQADKTIDIDLNGFAIRGPNECSYDFATRIVSCTSPGTGNGIQAGTVNHDLRIRNGTIRGMGSRGILASFVGSLVSIDHVDLIDNGNDGLRTGGEARVESVRALDNGGDGVSIGRGGVVTDSSAHRNGGNGFTGGDDTLFRSNVATRNTGFGFGQLAPGEPVFNFNVSDENGTDTLPGIKLGSNACGGSAGGC